MDKNQNKNNGFKINRWIFKYFKLKKLNIQKTQKVKKYEVADGKPFLNSIMFCKYPFKRLLIYQN